MGVPPTAKSLQSLGNTLLRFTKCTGNKLTSQPESHKQLVNTPLIYPDMYTNWSLVDFGASTDKIILALVTGGCSESTLSFSASSAFFLLASL